MSAINTWIFTLLKNALLYIIKVELMFIVMVITYESHVVHLFLLILKYWERAKESTMKWMSLKKIWSLYKNCTHLVVEAVLFIDFFVHCSVVFNIKY